MRAFSPRRSPPAPVAGAFLSVTAHAVLLGAAVASARPGGEGDAAEVPAGAAVNWPMPAASGGERLHWVGVGAGGGGRAARARPGARPPNAYVVPGRLSRRGDAPVPEGARDRARREAGPADPSPGVAPGPSRSPPPPRARRPVALPDVAFPDADLMLLVAGVISAAPDLAREVSRPEDFVPPAERGMTLLARVAALSPGVLRPDTHVDDLPIPLVSNPLPTYPAALALAHVEGRVIVEFMIDSTGVVDLGTLQVVQSTNALFVQAVRHVLPRLRFMPAQRGEQAVGVTVRQPFLFTARARR